MNSRKFEYYHRDIAQLKKDIGFRALFCLMFLGAFVWQSVIMILEISSSQITVMKIVASCITLLCSLLLFVVTLAYAFKDFRIISAIKMQGKCVSSVNILIATNKKSFIWLYGLLIQILTLATTLLLVACVTYSILQAAYLSTVSFYLPMLLMICASGYNSVYHIKDEIRTQKNVQMQQPQY